MTDIDAMLRMNTTRYSKEEEQIKVKGLRENSFLMIRICAKTQCTPNCYVMENLRKNYFGHGEFDSVAKNKF